MFDRRLLHDLIAIPFVLVKRCQKQFPRRQLCDARLVIVRFSYRNPFTGERIRRYQLTIGDSDVVFHQTERVHQYRLIDRAIGIVTTNVPKNDDPGIFHLH